MMFQPDTFLLQLFGSLLILLGLNSAKILMPPPYPYGGGGGGAYGNSYYDHSYNYTGEISSTEPTYNETYDYGYDYDYGHRSRIRYFKAIEVNVNITIDIQLSIPLPYDAGSLDIDIPISIIIQNKTVFKLPYPDPPLKFPLFYPVIKLPKLPKLPSFLSHDYQQQGQDYYYPSDHQELQQQYQQDLQQQQQQQQQQSKQPQSPYSDYSSDQALLDYYAHPRHQLAKRSLAAQSAVHRFEIFSCIERSLDQHGYQGRSCLLKAICQLTQRELLIESALHEVLEHLLTVSRGVDEDRQLEVYRAAEEFGAANSNASDACGAQYRCAFSIFEPVDSVESLLLGK